MPDSENTGASFLVSQRLAGWHFLQQFLLLACCCGVLSTAAPGVTVCVLWEEEALRRKYIETVALSGHPRQL